MDNASLHIAERKFAEGRGLKNSEITLLRAVQRAQSRVFSARQQPTRSVVPAADLASNMLAGKDRLYTPDVVNAGSVSSIISSGGVFTEFTYCDSGSPVTAWWPIWASDPS